MGPEHSTRGFPIGFSGGHCHRAWLPSTVQRANFPHLAVEHSSSLAPPHKQPLNGSPVHPALHLQSTPPMRSWQMAPVPQGFDWQSFLSITHSMLGFPKNLTGHEHFFRCLCTVHWALVPQALGREQGSLQDPSIHFFEDSQSRLRRHSTFLHSTFGLPCRPSGHRQTGLWLDTLHLSLIHI